MNVDIFSILNLMRLVIENGRLSVWKSNNGYIILACNGNFDLDYFMYIMSEIKNMGYHVTLSAEDCCIKFEIYKK